MGSRTPPADAGLLPGPLKRPAEDYFKMFLADTALSGAVEATRCGLDYFGADKVLFASDFPFDAEGGKYLVRETIKALDALDLHERFVTKSILETLVTSFTGITPSVHRTRGGYFAVGAPIVRMLSGTWRYQGFASAYDL